MPGLLLGAGLGGFADGIVLHQILRWHHLLTDTDEYPATTVRGLEVNTTADGLFHFATWIVTLLGVAALWRASQHAPSLISARSLIGWMLIGWGAFNLVEGIVNHHILQIHHVREGSNEIFFDIAFLTLGLVLLLGGRFLLKRTTYVQPPAARLGR